ncbi:hypothetical protein ACJX0J_018011, partial [Zea mays]
LRKYLYLGSNTALSQIAIDCSKKMDTQTPKPNNIIKKLFKTKFVRELFLKYFGYFMYGEWQQFYQMASTSGINLEIRIIMLVEERIVPHTTHT